MVKKIVEILKKSNMITYTDLDIHNINKQDLETFCNLYGLQYHAKFHGNWNFIMFSVEDGKLLSPEQIRSHLNLEHLKIKKENYYVK